MDKSTELAGTAKTELDTSTQKAGEAKTALDGSARTAGEIQETLNATVKQAGALDTSLGEKIETGTQLKTDLVASGEKAVQDIQNAGSEQLGKMQAVAEEFTADREQINVNKEDISILKEEMGKNYLDDAKTKRSLDALWKLNQGISYQFETDAERAYQKDIPSGAKLASVKKIGGRTIVWNQLAGVNTFRARYGSIKFEDSKILYTVNETHIAAGVEIINQTIPGHKYLLSKTILSPHATYTSNNSLDTPGNYTINANQKVTIRYICESTQGRNNVRIYFPTKNNDENDSFEVGDTIEISDVMLIDLTKMFGAGNEPSTLEEFEALFPEDYYPYNEGTLMSIPVNEVAEHGKNYFDFSKLVSDGVNAIDYEKQTITVPAKTNNTGYNQTLRDLCPEITPGTYVFSAKRSNPESGNGSYFLEAGLDFIFNTPTELTDALLDNHIAWYNNPDSDVENVISEIQLEKNSVKTSYSQYYQKSHKIPQAILNLDGYGDGVSDDVYNYVDWENKEYHKRVGKYTIDGSENIVKEKSYWVMTVTDFEKPRPSTINAICTNFKAGKAFFNKWGNIIFRSSSNGFVFTDSESKFANANEVKDYFQQNNETIYYELAEEQIIDISDIIDNTFQEPIEVEAGGTLTFHNSNGDGYRLPVPNEEEYIVSLAEVGGGASE